MGGLYFSINYFIPNVGLAIVLNLPIAVKQLDSSVLEPLKPITLIISFSQVFLACWTLYVSNDPNLT
jgi:hypothetical protein